ncbi:MAG: type I 3-dehydroquinate dehydratase [Methanosarcinales archaeon]|nr:type I 3-dehydroquinate dehydratase [Methanosarcinales archaeon]
MVRIGNFDLGKGPGIVAAIGSDALNTAKRARVLGASILEVRLDLLGIRDADEATALLDDMKEQVGLPIIATNRCTKEGGQWSGSEAGRIDLLLSTISRADAVDIELSAPLRSKVGDTVKSAGKTLIISSHDFRTTPSSDAMLSILVQEKEAGADIAKLAVTPAGTADTLRLLEITQQAGFPVCTIAMGRPGAHTRVVAPLYGSVLTYGAVDEAVAPGQLKIDELKHMLELLT